MRLLPLDEFAKPRLDLRGFVAPGIHNADLQTRLEVDVGQRQPVGVQRLDLTAADPFLQDRWHAEEVVGLGRLVAAEEVADFVDPGDTGILFQKPVISAYDRTAGEC